MVQENLNDDEVVLVELSDQSRLVLNGDGSASFLERKGDEDFVTDYDSLKNAHLHAALWLLADGFRRPADDCLSFVPTEIVATGKHAVAAWLFLNGASGYPVSRRLVADRLGVSEQTVSQYLSRVRKEIEIKSCRECDEPAVFEYDYEQGCISTTWNLCRKCGYGVGATRRITQ